MRTGGSAIYAQYFCAVIVTNLYQICCVNGIGAIMEHLYMTAVIYFNDIYIYI